MEAERVKALEVQMKDLIGNGQPGRVGRLEEEVKSHSKLLWLGMGGLYALQIFPALLSAIQKMVR